jgi:parvulin-like peptidyl-prolyl isomerase
MGIAAALLLLSSCSSGTHRVEPSPEPPPPSVRPPADLPPDPMRPEAVAAAAGELAVARVDGEAIPAAAAFRLVYLSAPEQAASAVRQLVIDRLAAAEAAASGASVPAQAVERELARMLADQERKVREASKGATDLATFVKETWQLEPAAYFALVRGSVERSLLLERVVLDELRRHARTQLRLIRVKERRLAEEIRGKVEQGADFAALARQHSEDPTARAGGIYPPLPSDLPSPLFEQTAELAAGALSEVTEVSTPDGPRYRIVQVLARLPAESGSFAERAASIEQTLADRPLSPLELEAWMRIMEDRHSIEVLGPNFTGSEE